jgi:integrase
MPKATFTDRSLQALPPAPKGTRYDRKDSEVRGLAIRVSDTGRKVFVLIARYPGGTNAVRRTIGEYPDISLEEARDIARDWRKLLRQRKDPKIEEERRKAHSFQTVAEQYIEHVKRLGQRRAGEVERVINRELLPKLKGKDITEVTRQDITLIIQAAINRGAPAMAHGILAVTKRLFNWAINGPGIIEHAPTDRIKPSILIGQRSTRSRVLTDEELKDLWKAANKLKYPIGPIVKLLVLTGLRRSEVAEARWSEFDLEKKVWVIPAERMKNKKPHAVPLIPVMINILGKLPRFKKGDALFSYSFGQNTVTNYSQIKYSLDDEFDTETPWTLHDIRRTMRTHLSSLPIEDLVRELVLAHSKGGMHRVYDLYQYLDEKREALELWSEKLRKIVRTPSDD